MAIYTFNLVYFFILVLVAPLQYDLFALEPKFKNYIQYSLPSVQAVHFSAQFKGTHAEKFVSHESEWYFLIVFNLD